MSAGAAALAAHRFEGADGLRAARDAWREVLRDSNADPLGNDPDWALAHVLGFGTGDDVFGWVLDEGNEPVAVLAFRREPSRGPLALRRARLAAAGTFDSDYLDLVARRGREAEVASRALELLARERRVDAVVLDCVPDGSAALGALREQLEARRLPARARPEPCCATALPDDAEAFLASLKSRMRSKVRQAVRRTTEAGGTLAWCESADEVPETLDALFELHQRRWEAAGEPGSFAGEERRAFYRELAPRLLEDGRLGLARLDLDGRVVACQIGAVVGERYYQIQEGYDPDLGDLRLGIALRGLAIPELIARGVRQYDFMAGVSRGKTDWGAELRPCTTIAFALPRLRARAAYGLRAWLDRRRDR